MTFDITKFDASSSAVVTVDNSYSYTGSAIEPVPTVKIGEHTLTKDIDYTVSYSNNTNVGTEAEVRVTFKGNYTGTASTTFAIVTGELTSSDVTIEGIEDVTYKASEWRFTITITLNGQVMPLDSTEYSIEYENNINAGTARIIISFVKNYSGEIVETFTINKAKLGISWNALESYEYNGQTQGPTATITGLLENDVVGLDISGYQINVGTNYSINVAGLIWEDASNYELATDVDLSKTLVL